MEKSGWKHLEFKTRKKVKINEKKMGDFVLFSKVVTEKGKSLGIFQDSGLF